MKTRDKVFIAIGVVAAVVCIRLGFWQLGRLAERKELNTQLRARAETRPVGLSEVPTDTGSAHFTRVTLSGTYDFDNEIRITSRSRNGSPGINIITPLRQPGTDTAVLVNRGWVYAPDGMTVDLTKWREPQQMEGQGYIENYGIGRGNARLAKLPDAYRWMDYPTISRAFPYPIRPYYVVLIGDSGRTPQNIPPRVEVPPLDEGPHKSYAVQWFSFAAISIFGMILYSRRK